MKILFRRSFVTLVVLCAWLGCCHSARAWNAEGHMVAAQIAYSHLTPAVKARCDALIAQPVFDVTSVNTNFVTAACWADDIKSQTSAFSNWHFVDYPLSLDGTSTNSFVTPSSNVVWAINNCIAALQDPTTSISNQAVNLRFLIHFMGDLTQPLHCSTGISAKHPNGDAGGNSFTLSVSPGNLHSLWDAGAGYLSDSVTRPFTVSSQAIITNKAADVEAAYPYSVSFTSLQNVTNWALESWNLARTVAYVGITEGSAPSQSYLATGSDTSKQRMAVAGHRMADLLNLILTRTDVVLNTLDTGAGSLRDTVANAQAGDIIIFTNTLSGQTILLTSGQIVLSNNLTIDGSALPNSVQINGNLTSRIFQVNAGVQATLNALILTNGFAGPGNWGGAIANSGTLALNNCTLTFNFADSTANGGGIQNGGVLTVTGCTFYRNSAAFSGAIDNRATCTAVNCTFYANHAVLGNGGAIDNAFGATLSLLQCTFVANTATSLGAGIDNYLSIVNFTNSILAGNLINSTPSDIFNWNDSTNFASGTNIVQAYGNNGTVFGTNTILLVDPQLATLDYYGGLTATMPPLAGSPAVDAGSDAAVAGILFDQRGLPRISGDHVDIGAAELQLITSGTPAQITSATWTANVGSSPFKLTFTSQTGTSFRVFSSTNFALPFANWMMAGFATESPAGSGHFQFTDPQATTNSRTFYRLRSP